MTRTIHRKIIRTRKIQEQNPGKENKGAYALLKCANLACPLLSAQEKIRNVSKLQKKRDRQDKDLDSPLNSVNRQSPPRIGRPAVPQTPLGWPVLPPGGASYPVMAEGGKEAKNVSPTGDSRHHQFTLTGHAP